MASVGGGVAQDDCNDFGVRGSEAEDTGQGSDVRGQRRPERNRHE